MNRNFKWTVVFYICHNTTREAVLMFGPRLLWFVSPTEPESPVTAHKDRPSLDPVGAGDVSTSKSQTLILLFRNRLQLVFRSRFLPMWPPVSRLLLIWLLVPQIQVSQVAIQIWDWLAPQACYPIFLLLLACQKIPNLVLLDNQQVVLTNTTRLEKVLKLANWALFIPTTLTYTLHPTSLGTTGKTSGKKRSVNCVRLRGCEECLQTKQMSTDWRNVPDPKARH